MLRGALRDEDGASSILEFTPDGHLRVVVPWSGSVDLDLGSPGDLAVPGVSHTVPRVT